MTAPRIWVRTALPAMVLVASVTAGCGQDDPAPSSKKSASGPPAPAPPPIYSADHIKAGLLSADEIGRKIQELPVAVEALRKQQAPMCSLSGTTLPGDPEITVRQYSNGAQGAEEVKYAQLIARYDDAAAATGSFQSLKTKASACPAKRHVPVKQVRKNVATLAHDDSWKLTEQTTAGWSHLHGIERQTYGAATTKFNVLQFMYDYAVRGNVVIASVYWERTEPKKSPDPIEHRAMELLTKQLQKFR